ncbi:MAG: hypothetical protein ACI8VT_003040 [Saprospiraceae bacterium]|jgi:hypothetical protein
MICSNCQHKIESSDRFCNNCGAQVGLTVVSDSGYAPKYSIDFKENPTIDSQIRAHFFKTLETVIEEEIGANEYRKYFDQFYKSEFYKNFDLRTVQLAEEINTIHSGSDQYANQKIDQILVLEFAAFIDHFLIMYCQKLHGMALPEAMLQYTKTTRAAVNLRQMLLDYMDFEKEQEKVYTDLLSIPPAKIKNAIQSFVFAQAQEKIFFICDQTVFGSCKEGFAMTDSTLYWKSHFNPAQSVAYHDLKEIKRDAEWININGLFFNVNKSVNFKMLKLLKKLRYLYAD